jgi:hypothetical protein
MRFGSHLYGTDTPLSDLDLKGVYMPPARDILLQRVKPVISVNPPKPAGQRNAPGDVDREYFSLQRYLGLLAEGQTMALDMLFAPESAMTTPPARCGGRYRRTRTGSSRAVPLRSSAIAASRPTLTASRVRAWPPPALRKTGRPFPPPFRPQTHKYSPQPRERS